ncbi:MAG: alginate export family protein [Desulfobacteraceae bacterium]|nr:alginate export family protein [Desulfobacteraceae bacterium]
MKKRWFLNSVLLVCLSCLVCTGQSAIADVEFKNLNSVLDSARLGFDQFFFYRIDSNPYFGSDVTPGDTDSDFGEIVSKLRLSVSKNLPFANIEAQFALIYMSTIGADMYMTSEDENELGADQAWINFENLFASPLSMRIGEQNLQIEKQFLVGIGRYNRLARWLFQNQSFPLAVQINGDYGALKSTLFWAESRDYWQNFNETVLVSGDFASKVGVSGLNLHYDFSENTYIYGGLIAKLDDSDTQVPGVFSSNSQTINFDLGVNYTLGNLLLEGELVHQRGDAGTWYDVEQDRNAYGGFAALTWNFGTTIAPWVKLQYDYFSGDKDFGSGNFDSDMEAFDPMFYGFPGWERWFIGEISGELHLDNSNKHVISLEAGFKPHQTTTVTAVYLNTMLDENYSRLTALADDHWSDEVNVFIDYFPNNHMWLHLGAGYAKPGDAAKELLGDKDNLFVQSLIGFFF